MKLIIMSLLTSAAATGGFVAHDQLPTLTGTTPPAVAAPAPQTPAGGFQVIATCDDPTAAPSSGRTAPRTVTVRVPQAAPAASQAPQAAAEQPQASQAPQAAQTAPSADGRVNVNTASETELNKVPGIGEATVAKIVPYRQAHPFKSIDEVDALPGVNAENFALMKDHITV